MINLVNHYSFGLLQHISCILSGSVKVLLYKTIIRPVLTYAYETRTISKQNESILQYFERKNGLICNNLEKIKSCISFWGCRCQQIYKVNQTEMGATFAEK